LKNIVFKSSFKEYRIERTLLKPVARNKEGTGL
jgi:hypothetical protein